ncbi:MAG: hypothetical protein AAB730_00010 [Patescibacteria group bacterium]
MTFSWAFLALFLSLYAIFSLAVIWHLNTYSFSRSAKWVTRFFVLAAVVLAVFAILFFSQINWAELLNYAQS